MSFARSLQSVAGATLPPPPLPVPVVPCGSPAVGVGVPPRGAGREASTAPHAPVRQTVNARIVFFITAARSFFRRGLSTPSRLRDKLPPVRRQSSRRPLPCPR